MSSEKRGNKEPSHNRLLPSHMTHQSDNLFYLLWKDQNGTPITKKYQRTAFLMENTGLGQQCNPLKIRQQAPKSVIYAKPHLTKPRLNFITFQLSQKWSGFVFFLFCFLDFNVFILLFTFNWRIITLQCCCDSFCCVTTWIRYKYTYIPSLLRLPPPTPIPPLWVIIEHQIEFLYYGAAST